MTFLTNIFKNRAQNKLNKACLEAANAGDFKLCLELIEQGVDVNLVGTVKEISDYGSTYNVATSPGYDAILKQNIKALLAIINKGLDINLVVNGKPLVMHAIEMKNEPAAVLLLQRGAKADYVRSDLETPLSLAEKEQFNDAARLIHEQQAVTTATETAAIVPMKPLTLKPAPSTN